MTVLPDGLTVTLETCGVCACRVAFSASVSVAYTVGAATGAVSLLGAVVAGAFPEALAAAVCACACATGIPCEKVGFRIPTTVAIWGVCGATVGLCGLATGLWLSGVCTCCAGITGGCCVVGGLVKNAAGVTVGLGSTITGAGFTFAAGCAAVTTGVGCPLRRAKLVSSDSAPPDWTVCKAPKTELPILCVPGRRFVLFNFIMNYMGVMN